MDNTLATIEPGISVEEVYRTDASRLWRAIFACAGGSDIADESVAEAYPQVVGRGTAVSNPAAWTWRAHDEAGCAARRRVSFPDRPPRSGSENPRTTLDAGPIRGHAQPVGKASWN